MTRNNLEFYWFLPLEKDVKYIGTLEPTGPLPTVEYLSKIVTASESAGFKGLLVPTSYNLDLENWLTATSVLSRTKEAKMIIAVRPNQYHPAQAAKMVQTLYRLYPDRLALNILAGSSYEDGWIGIFDTPDQKMERLEEWLKIFKGVLYEQSPFSFNGNIYNVVGNQLDSITNNSVDLFFSGGSKRAKEIAVEHAKTYLLFGTTIEQVKKELQEVRDKFNSYTNLSFGMRLQIIVRENEDEAWRNANDLISKVDPRVKEYLINHPHFYSLGENAKERIQNGDFLLGPNLWGGIGTARLGNSTALVGNPQQIVDRLLEYHALGINKFILSGYPKLDEVVNFGKLISPILRECEIML